MGCGVHMAHSMINSTQWSWRGLPGIVVYFFHGLGWVWTITLLSKNPAMPPPVEFHFFSEISKTVPAVVQLSKQTPILYFIKYLRLFAALLVFDPFISLAMSDRLDQWHQFIGFLDPYQFMESDPRHSLSHIWIICFFLNQIFYTVGTKQHRSKSSILFSLH